MTLRSSVPTAILPQLPANYSTRVPMMPLASTINQPIAAIPVTVHQDSMAPSVSSIIDLVETTHVGIRVGPCSSHLGVRYYADLMV